jgi:hypothetical protein
MHSASLTDEYIKHKDEEQLTPLSGLNLSSWKTDTINQERA